MKNLVSIESNCGFLCSTPHGADCKTCPYCDTITYVEFEDYEFCASCGIIFEIGCKYEVRGCTSDIYNGHFIGKLRYKEEVYVGMPQFAALDELQYEIKDIEIIEWVCINKGAHSDSPCSYSYDKYPQYYKPCWLNEI